MSSIAKEASKAATNQVTYDESNTGRLVNHRWVYRTTQEKINAARPEFKF